MSASDPSTAPTLLGEQPTVHSEPYAELAGEKAAAPELTTLGARYEIVSLIGSGGMGTVYKAKDHELDELVALKMLKGNVSTLESVERFRREVKLARRVTHKNIARVFEFGEHAGRRFFTMELVEGESLRSLLTRSGVLSVKAALETALCICDGLAAAHEAGVIHRDLKPDNVLIGPLGRVAITDFGIAASVDGSAGFATSSFIGTPDYMAPEQVDGSMAPDGRTDLYALGALLFELLAGRPPFSGPSALAIAAARLTRPAPSLAELAPSAPLRVVQAVDRCLARDPAQRFAFVQDLRHELQTALSALSVATLPPPSSIHSRQAPSFQGPVVKMAVLPFTSVGLVGQEYLASGLTEDLIDSLAASNSVRVIGLGTTAALPQTNTDPRAIGRELNVEVVVYGSLRATPDGRLLVTVRMVAVTDGIQLWSQRFGINSSEILQLNDTIARALLQAVPGGGVPVATELEDPVAVDLYLQAKSRFREFWYESSSQAEALYEQALQRAPNSPLLVAGHALVLARCAFFEAERLPAATEAADRAMLLAPDRGESLVAAGTVAIQARRITDAYRFAQAAIVRAPSLLEAHLLRGRILAETGPLLDAERSLRIACELDPRSVAPLRELARVHALLGRWDLVDRALESERSGMDAVSLAITTMRFALWNKQMGAFLSVRETLANLRDPLRALAPRFSDFLDALMLATPDADGVVTLLKSIELTGSSPRRAIFFLQLAAEAQSVLGNLEVALGLLDQANNLGLTDLAWLDCCPALASLRADARFGSRRELVLERVAEVLRLHAAVSGRNERAS